MDRPDHLGQPVISITVTTTEDAADWAAMRQALWPKDNPGILMDVSFDQNGDIDRESFMTRVENGKQVVFAVLPPLSAK